MTLFPTLAVLYFTIIFFAGEPIWVYSSAELFILVVSFVLLLVFTLRSKPAGKTALKIYKDPVTIFGFLFLLLVCFQMIPWPPNLVEVLSPRSLAVWKRAPLPEGSFFPVSVYPYATKHGLIFSLCLLLVYWWVLYGIKDRREMEKLALGIVLFGALVAFYGLLETSTGHDQVLWWKKIYGQGTVTATFFNRNHLATFLSMNLLVGVGYFWFLWASTQKGIETGKIRMTRQIEERIKKLGLKGFLTGLSLLILVFGLLSTGSRGGNLSTLAGLILMGGFIRTRSAQKRGVASFSLLIMVIVAFGAYAAGDQLWERLKQEPFEPIQTTSGLSRPGMNKDTWAMVRDYPSLGSGFNTFRYVFTRYAEHSPKYLDHAHNDWLELAAESGGAGLLIILSGLFWAACRLLKTTRSDSDSLAVGMTIGGLGVLLAVSLHSLTDFSLHKPANAFLLAVILGLAFRAIYLLGSSPLKEGVGPPSMSVSAGMAPLEGRPGKRIGLFSPGNKGGVFLALFVLLGFSTCLWSANTVVRSLLMNLWIPAELDVTGERPDPGLEQAITAISINPEDSAGWAWLSQTLQSEEKIIPDAVFHRLMEIGKSRWAKEKPGIPVQEYQMLFPVLEALSRRPVAPHYWYRLVFASRDFLDHNPSFYTPLIAGAYDNILFFDPQSGIGYLERGTFCLQHEKYFSEKRRGDCLDDLKKSLELEPGLIPRIIEALAKGSFPLKILMDILPKGNALAWISAGETLLDRNQLTLGETIYLKGEQLKIKETEVLIIRIKNQLHGKRGLQLENLKRELIDLDPDHPLIWYVRGDILRACEQAHKRGWPLGRLDEITRLRSILKSLKPGNDSDRMMPRFYLALLDLEEKSYKEAAGRLDMVLEEKPNFYSALLAWEQTADQLSKTEDGKIFLQKIQKKITLFSMEEIPSGAWVATGRPEENEQKSYRAVLRNQRPLSELKIAAPVEAERWTVVVDGRFVAAREIQERVQTINLQDPIVPGEHQVIIKSLQIDKEIKGH
jgi:O-antigen ligase/tetratricopeptide (TPR) repeat protein